MKNASRNTTVRSRVLPVSACALVGTLCLGLAACGGSSAKTGTGPNGSTTVFSGTVPNGGSLVIGAEQEPDCFDWLGQCSGSQWGTWMAQIETVPMAFRSVPHGDDVALEPSSVLAGEPKFDSPG